MDGKTTTSARMALYVRALGVGALGATCGVIFVILLFFVIPLAKIWFDMLSGSGGEIGGGGISEFFVLVAAVVGFLSGVVWTVIRSSEPQD